MKLYRDKSQSIVEYAMILAVAVSAIVGMQVYVRRGLQGRLRDSSDFLVEKINKEAGSSYANQYEPYYRDTEKKIIQSSTVSHKMFDGGRQRKEYLEGSIRVNQREVIHESRETK